LIDATIDTLAVGLKERDFTSVDLVNVRYLLFNENQDIQLSLKFVYVNYTLRSMPFCFPLSYLKASLLYNASAVSGLPHSLLYKSGNRKFIDISIGIPWEN